MPGAYQIDYWVILATREGLLRVFQVFWAVFSHFSSVWSRILAENQHTYISDLEMSGYSNRGKVMKKTVTVPMLSRGPVLQSRGNLLDSSGNGQNGLPRNGQNGDENGHMAVPMYRLSEEPILPSVSLAMYYGHTRHAMGIPRYILVAYWLAYWLAYGHFGYILWSNYTVLTT